jgi:hypothetical protein
VDQRQDYVAPAIAAEDVLEQTSLACQVTQFPFDQGNFGPQFQGCAENVTKGGAYFPDLCVHPFPTDGQLPVVMS